jgi:hypothetical protein
MRFSELIPTLQISISPVILISGIGLLLLSMTNRLGRVIDRARQIAGARRQAESGSEKRVEEQFQMLIRRATLLRRAIILSVVSVLVAALLIITLFVTALARSDLGWPIVVLFTFAMITLIASLVFFIQDLNLSLEAMKLDTMQ